MRYLVLFALLSLFITNCDPVNDDATSVCNCYKELYKISSDDEVQMQMVYDSCAKLHADVIIKLKDDTAAFNEYIEAYTFCQNQ